MAELGPDAEALVRAGRGSFKPSAADRERIARALEARLGGSGAASNEGAAPRPAPAASATPGLGGKALALVGTGLVVGAAFVAWTVGTHTDAAPTAALAPVVSASAPVVAAVPEPVPPSGETSPTPVDALPTEPRAVATRRASGRLAEEVAILSQAEKELHAGRAASALALLEEHRQKFPNGALAQERIAARIHALCALGRVTEAEAALARLRKVSPGSPQEGRAREACAPGAKR